MYRSNRWALQLQKLEERLELEKEEWQAQIISKMQLESHNRERQLRAKLIEERDAEIEMVIQRLEMESSTSSSDLSRQHRADVERLKAEHQSEMRQV